MASASGMRVVVAAALWLAALQLLLCHALNLSAAAATAVVALVSAVDVAYFLRSVVVHLHCRLSSANRGASAAQAGAPHPCLCGLRH